MAKTDSADVVIAGTGVIGCLIAEELLDAGLSVLMLEAGPKVDRARITENYRSVPPGFKLIAPDAPYPPVPWAPHPEAYTGDPDKDYLITTGPNAQAYQQTFIRYAGGSTWHWAGSCWRLTAEDMMLKSKFGVGRDWPFPYEVLEPYYTRAEYALGVCGPQEAANQWPPDRSKPYPMGPQPFNSGQQLCVEAAARIGKKYIHTPQARNSGVSYQGRPPCGGTNNCQPVCAIGAKYDAAGSLQRLESKGAIILTNSVVYKIETDEKNQIQALHYFSPDKTTHRVTGKTFVIACNGIESPKLLLMSKNDKNPNGLANSSDQLGRNMMDQPKILVSLEFKSPVWTGLGPVEVGAIMEASQGSFRGDYCGTQISMVNPARTALAGLAALKKGLVGKALDQEIRRLSACTGNLYVEHEIMPQANNRLTLSDKKDWLGLNKPSVYYDVTDYVRTGRDKNSMPLCRDFAKELGATSFKQSDFIHSDHIMGGTIMGTDPANSVVDPDCRTHDHANLFVPGGAAMPSAGSGNSTLTMSAVALKSADAIVAQMKRG